MKAGGGWWERRGRGGSGGGETETEGGDTCRSLANITALYM